MLRSVGGDPDVSSIPFLGGVSAAGAIVAVLAVFAPSGLGVREASMYGLLLAVVGEAVALGAIVINRLVITLVEAALLLVGRAAPAPPAWRGSRGFHLDATAVIRLLARLAAAATERYGRADTTAFEPRRPASGCRRPTRATPCST